MTKTILFVCTGNSCRSVIAEGLFRKLLSEAGEKNVRVTSAGTAAPRGVGPPGEVEEVMKGEGVDVSSYRSTPLTVDLIEEADLVLVMGERHRQDVLEIGPGASKKVFLLKEFSPNPKEGFLGIPDPIGCSLPVYEDVLREIKSCLQGLLKKLDGYLP
ncbi:low molecular weight protein arginine phosphatase [candidate division NPL-UPA2 bacterium]|nr:low molecular weight protein arginine phosphatase [candidate division NPL-UPA2 bacterium]